jgi:hypothetical protein
VNRSQLEGLLSVLLLAEFIWVVLTLIPMAARNGDAFEIACALIAAVVALVAWLLLASAVSSG